MAWIVMLVATLVGIGQPISFGVYQVAIVALVVLGLSQIAVGNVPPDAGPARFWRFNAAFFVAIVVLFALSIWLAPILVNLGR
jgi:hypothetical protein